MYSSALPSSPTWTRCSSHNLSYSVFAVFVMAASVRQPADRPPAPASEGMCDTQRDPVLSPAWQSRCRRGHALAAGALVGGVGHIQVTLAAFGEVVEQRGADHIGPVGGAAQLGLVHPAGDAEFFGERVADADPG